MISLLLTHRHQRAPRRAMAMRSLHWRDSGLRTHASSLSKRTYCCIPFQNVVFPDPGGRGGTPKPTSTVDGTGSGSGGHHEEGSTKFECSMGGTPQHEGAVTAVHRRSSGGGRCSSHTHSLRSLAWKRSPSSEAVQSSGTFPAPTPVSRQEARISQYAAVHSAGYP